MVRRSFSSIAESCLLIMMAIGGILLSVYTGWSFWQDVGTLEMKGIASLIQGTLAVLYLVVALMACRALYHNRDV
jgi:hypothetical protein